MPSSENDSLCFARGVDGEGNPNCRLASDHDGPHSDTEKDAENDAPVKCDYCDQPATQLAGEADGVLVCNNHAEAAPAERAGGAAVEAVAEQVIAEHDWRWAIRDSRTGEGVRIACMATGCDWAAERVDPDDDIWGAQRRHVAEQIAVALSTGTAAEDYCGAEYGETRTDECECRRCTAALALELSRQVYQAERRAEEAEFHVEQLRDARDNAERKIERTERLIDSWEHDAPDHSNPVFIGRLRECLRRDPAPIRLRVDYEPCVVNSEGKCSRWSHGHDAEKGAPMCMCGHRWWRHQDSNLSPECLDCDCAQFKELTPAGVACALDCQGRGLMGAGNDAWGERPEDVLLCTHQEESGHCSLPYGHDGGHVIPPKGEANTAACPLGYTRQQIEALMGDRLEAFDRWMLGKTQAICDGRRYDHDRREYEPTECADSPHGLVTYPWDVRRFLGHPPAKP